MNGTVLVDSLTEFTVYASTDDFANSELGGSYPETLAQNTDQELVLGLGGMADNTFEAGESVEFRVNFEDRHSLATRVYRIDNVSVSGIPEPTSLSLLALAGAAHISRRQR